MVTMDKILRMRNVNGEIYLSDIQNWLGDDIPLEKCKEVRKELNKLKSIRSVDGKVNRP